MPFPDYVIDKDGNILDSYTFDDWNEYVTAYILLKHYYMTYRPTLILAKEHKKTKCKYEDAYNIMVSGDTVFQRLSELKDNDIYFIIHCNRESYNDSEEIERSLRTLTEGFENNPIKAYFRALYYYRYTFYSQDSPGELFKTYWIYAFFILDPNRCEYKIPIDKINVRNALICMIRSRVYNLNLLLESVIYQEELQRQKEEQLKEKHQKEIEELLAPGGDAYLVAKERFENTQKELDDGLG